MPRRAVAIAATQFHSGIEKVLPRFEPRSCPPSAIVASAWVMKPSPVVTNRYGSEEIARFVAGAWQRKYAAEIDFVTKTHRQGENRFPLGEVVYSGSNAINRRINFANLYLVVIRLGPDASKFPPLAPEHRIKTAHIKDGIRPPIYIIGFPTEPLVLVSEGDQHPAGRHEYARVPVKLYRNLSSFCGKCGAPGLVEAGASQVADDACGWVMSQDAGTLADQSESCVVDFGANGEQVFGLHVGGIARTENYAHVIAARQEKLAIIESRGLKWRCAMVEEALCQVSQSDIDRLVENVLSAFPDPHDLDRAVRRGTGDRLFVEYVASGQPQRRTVEQLFDALEAAGTTVFFLRGALAERPRRQDLRALIAQLCPAALIPLPKLPTALVQKAGQALQMPPNAEVPGLERNVRPRLQQVNVRIWVDLLARRERCVCRIECQGRPLGTGFLVGPEVVLTNWHVVQEAALRSKLDAIGCRFDYATLPDGSTREGVLIPLHIAGCIDHSPYSPAELTSTPEAPPPTFDQLDYALLRLAYPAGRESPELGAPARGWIALQTKLPLLETGAPLLILQHPHGAPVTLALDTEAVLGMLFGGLRLRYATNTEHGSSGSPCFTMDWQLVALHHFGDPTWQAPRFNQGVPIDRIRSRIVAGGHGHLIGGECD